MRRVGDVIQIRFGWMKPEFGIVELGTALGGEHRRLIREIEAGKPDLAADDRNVLQGNPELWCAATAVSGGPKLLLDK